MTDKAAEGKIAILLGGTSSEREVSIASGTAVYQALKSLGRDVICIDASDDPIGQIRKAKADIVFIALHGRFGEDGTIQAMLEQEKIPYTGSGPQASRLAMDKIESRKIFKEAGLPVPKPMALNKGLFEKDMPLNWDSHHFFPVVVKPNKEGSSIGLSVVNDADNLALAIDRAFQYDDDIVIEKFIEGEDITIGILEEKPLPVVHIKPKHGIYDFAAKYTKGMSEYIVPAQFDDIVMRQAQGFALKAHKLLGCRCFSRVDMRLTKDNKTIVLEVNSIPGLTQTSLLPKAAKAAGIDFAQVCLKMLENHG